MKPKNLPSIKLGLALVLVVVVAVVVLVVKANNGVLTSKQVRIVAAENFWGDIASQIGGDNVKVTSIISDPSADPHLYESNASNAVAISAADVVVTNGVGYDDFMDKLLSASPSNHRQVLSAAKIMGVSGNEVNPHLWYDTPRVKLVATRLEQALTAKDPAHKTEYERNLSTFEASLQPLLDMIAKIKAIYPEAPVAYTEPVPAYLLDNAGLSVKTPEGFASAIEEGNDPSPADTLAMDNLMTQHGVRVLLYNSQATSAVTQHVQDLAKASGVPVVGVTETIPKGEKNFQTWQLDQLNELLSALGR